MSNQHKLLKTNLQAQLNGVAILPFCLYGSPGVGKSSIISQVAKDLGASENTISISSVNYEFFTGIPTFATDTALDQYSMSGAKNVQATIWTIPELIASTNRMAESNPNGVILHLEDYHTMDKPTENVMYQLLLDRRLGDFKLHDRVAIIASMNDSKESGGGHFNSAAVKSRMTLLPYIFNFEDWYKGFGNTLHPWIGSFLKANTQYTVEPESKTLEPSASARSWTKLSLEFDLYNEETLLEVYMPLAAGKVSQNAVSAFENHVIYFNKLDFKSVVKNKTIPVLKDMNELDKVLWGYVVRSIETPADSVYLVDLLNTLSAQQHSESVVGFIAGELYTLYKIKMAGTPLTSGQEIVISKVLSTYKAADFNLTKTQATAVDKAVFTDSQALLTMMSSYI
jgi:hypothetical protein